MSRAPQSAADRGSLRVVLIGFNVAVLAAFLFAFMADWARLPGNRVVWFFVGVLTLIAGSLLRRHCFRVLGTFFSGSVTVQADHRVIESGAYRWVRHPSYSAALLIVLGIGVALGNWLSVVVSFRPSVPRLLVQGACRGAGPALFARAPGQFMAARKRFMPFSC